MFTIDVYRDPWLHALNYRMNPCSLMKHDRLPGDIHKTDPPNTPLKLLWLQVGEAVIHKRAVFHLYLYIIEEFLVCEIISG